MEIFSLVKSAIWWAQEHCMTQKTTSKKNQCYSKQQSSQDKSVHSSWSDPEHRPGDRCVCVKVNI